MKGIILAGGSGTRLYPITKSTCKQLLPVYDKPLIYYPLTVLMLAGIREIQIISKSKEVDNFYHMLGDGSDWGISISYAIQQEPRGLAEAFIVGKNFIKQDPCCVILGDNILYSGGMRNILKNACNRKVGASVFGYPVEDPERYGVVWFDRQGKAVKIEEKPKNPTSNYSIVGLYFYDNQVIDIAENLKPSPRGELEITDVNRVYLERDQLHVEKLGRGVAWFDAGTHDSLVEASQFIQIVEKRQGLKIACCEEVAYRMGYIDEEQLLKLADPLKKSGYGEYLLKILKESDRKTALN